MQEENINVVLIDFKNNLKFKKIIKTRCEEYNFNFTEDGFNELCENIKLKIKDMTDYTEFDSYFEDL